MNVSNLSGTELIALREKAETLTPAEARPFVTLLSDEEVRCRRMLTLLKAARVAFQNRAGVPRPDRDHNKVKASFLIVPYGLPTAKGVVRSGFKELSSYFGRSWASCIIKLTATLQARFPDSPEKWGMHRDGCTIWRLSKAAVEAIAAGGVPPTFLAPEHAAPIAGGCQCKSRSPKQNQCWMLEGHEGLHEHRIIGVAGVQETWGEGGTTTAPPPAHVNVAEVFARISKPTEQKS
jgi:hypothetical protein